jgi:hypothetical protein
MQANVIVKWTRKECNLGIPEDRANDTEEEEKTRNF